MIKILIYISLVGLISSTYSCSNLKNKKSLEIKDFNNIKEEEAYTIAKGLDRYLLGAWVSKTNDSVVKVILYKKRKIIDKTPVDIIVGSYCYSKLDCKIDSTIEALRYNVLLENEYLPKKIAYFRYRDNKVKGTGQVKFEILEDGKKAQWTLVSTSYNVYSSSAGEKSKPFSIPNNLTFIKEK